jgi:hypothetical protein
MILDRKIKMNLLVSLCAICIWTAVSFILFYPGTNGLGSSFSVVVIYIVTAYVFLATGILLLLLRLTNLIKGNSSLLYILTGSVNFCAGILAIGLFFTHDADMTLLHRSLLNLLIGFLMLADVFFRGKNQ